ncbi:MAG: hypothetical protein M1426_04275, partial [Patescibacteria group bacterium]|nr:hypothetical protein [Patescibacteria group bacterium]
IRYRLNAVTGSKYEMHGFIFLYRIFLFFRYSFNDALAEETTVIVCPLSRNQHENCPTNISKPPQAEENATSRMDNGLFIMNFVPEV